MSYVIAANLSLRLCETPVLRWQFGGFISFGLPKKLKFLSSNVFWS